LAVGCGQAWRGAEPFGQCAQARSISIDQTGKLEVARRDHDDIGGQVAALEVVEHLLAGQRLDALGSAQDRVA
jgi:hypothetical protein